ncbi:MAG: hypothetical protein AB7U95_28595, partial [Reyranella sp.]
RIENVPAIRDTQHSLACGKRGSPVVPEPSIEASPTFAHSAPDDKRLHSISVAVSGQVGKRIREA